MWSDAFSLSSIVFYCFTGTVTTTSFLYKCGVMSYLLNLKFMELYGFHRTEGSPADTSIVSLEVSGCETKNFQQLFVRYAGMLDCAVIAS